MVNGGRCPVFRLPSVMRLSNHERPYAHYLVVGSVNIQLKTTQAILEVTMPAGFLNDIAPFIDETLGLRIGKSPRYRNKTNYLKLSEASARNFDARRVIERIYATIESCRLTTIYCKAPSKHNWDLIPRRRTSADRDKLEVTLERDIVDLEGASWSAQVPTSSGLWDHKQAKRSAIDLIHKCGDDSYEFIELKIESGTPLFAAMEILVYGILYIYSRIYAEPLGYKVEEKPLLKAEQIHLKILAPEGYYANCNLDWLERKITRGLSDFLRACQCHHFQMDLKFEAFPKWFFEVKKPYPSNNEIREALRTRHVVYPRH